MKWFCIQYPQETQLSSFGSGRILHRFRDLSQRWEGHLWPNLSGKCFLLATSSQALRRCWCSWPEASWSWFAPIPGHGPVCTWRYCCSSSTGFWSFPPAYWIPHLPEALSRLPLAFAVPDFSWKSSLGCRRWILALWFECWSLCS